MASKKVKELRKAQYYVYYMGWKQCAGLYGRKYTDEVVRELSEIHGRNPYTVLNKLTVQISGKEIKINQEVDRGKGKVTKTKLPGIPAKDVSFAVQGPVPDDDCVAAIFLGYNPQTQCAVHVHVYRCDSAGTAEIMAEHFQQVTQIPEHRERLGRIHQDLVASGHIEPLCDYDMDADINHTNDDVHRNDRKPVFKSLADELKSKLSMADEAPILLPPIDYDTLSRAQGKLALRRHRKSLQYDSIAPGGVFIRKMAEPENSDGLTKSGSMSSSGSEPLGRSGDSYSSPFGSRAPLDRMSSMPDSPVETRRMNLGVPQGPQLRHTFQEGDFRRLRRSDVDY